MREDFSDNSVGGEWTAWKDAVVPDGETGTVVDSVLDAVPDRHGVYEWGIKDPATGCACACKLLCL